MYILFTGCNVCQACPAGQTPSTQTDSFGCPVCTCNCPTCPACPVGQYQTPLTDSNGCRRCQCCVQCSACPPGYQLSTQTDINGCPVCLCIPTTPGEIPTSYLCLYFIRRLMIV